ncbi:Zinc metalloproteinase nas-6 [Orchesella cincta]|uniref:Metalloendopeptidase n=1 Tax=Orchesella cincta TaxID=48709 RepID=A0A1D2M757_ORCCI|nr:Zinc metalloproteinase nas-6 [Orchesella cincta]
MRFAEGYDIKSGIIGTGTDGQIRQFRTQFPQHLVRKFASNEERNIVLGALAEISEKTCIRFVERAGQSDYVSIVRGEPNSGCWSYVGRIGGGQILNLQPGPGPHWHFHGIAAHEMIHALGFYHEQSRADRDDYVTIMWDNITPGTEGNFDKYSSSQVDPQGVPYDYGA